MADTGNLVLASAVSAWEVSIKIALGKLRAPGGLIQTVEESGVTWIPIQPREAYVAGALPLHHRDPFDRLLAAQVLDRSVSLISHDEVFDLYGIRRVWN